MQTQIMKHSPDRPFHRDHGFTLIELLVVISIIGVLASMLLPVVSRVKVKGQVVKARTEITDLVGAIKSYQSSYSVLPSPRDARAALGDAGATSPDFTFGTAYGGGWWQNKKGQQIQVQTLGVNFKSQANNSQIVAILEDLTHFRNGIPTPNVGHSLNSRKTRFLDARDVNDIRSPGVGPDGVYRDPWGNPYIISLDLNYDDSCRDGFYRLDAVSLDRTKNGTQGHNGLFKSKPQANSFEYRTQVMVWSLGPDGLAHAGTSAKLGVNKDNVLSWQ